MGTFSRVPDSGFVKGTITGIWKLNTDDSDRAQAGEVAPASRGGGSGSGGFPGGAPGAGFLGGGGERRRVPSDLAEGVGMSLVIPRFYGRFF